jgi:hypothetical protein
MKSGNDVLVWAVQLKEELPGTATAVTLIMKDESKAEVMHAGTSGGRPQLFQSKKKIIKFNDNYVNRDFWVVHR